MSAGRHGTVSDAFPEEPSMGYRMINEKKDIKNMIVQITAMIAKAKTLAFEAEKVVSEWL